MKRKIFILNLIFVMIFSFTFGVNAAEEYLNGETFEEVTLKKVERLPKTMDILPQIRIGFYFIHPKANIDYNINSGTKKSYNVNGRNYGDIIKFEEDLKQKYNIFLVQLKVDGDIRKFSLYEFKNSFTLEINEKKLNVIDFYDYKISGSASANYDSNRGDFKGDFGSHFIHGYLLFPKVKLEEAKVTLKNNYHILEDPIEMTWDLGKINKLVDVMSE